MFSILQNKITDKNPKPPAFDVNQEALLNFFTLSDDRDNIHFISI